MVTIRDVAREAGVSVASASRALNDHQNVTPETRGRVHEAARRLRYVPHEGARSLTRRRSDVIGVVLPDLFGEYFSELVRGIDRVAHASGLQLLLSNMHGSPHETASAIRTMRGRVDGLLVMPPEGDGSYLHDALPPGLPAVLLNHDETHGEASAVGVDNHGGAQGDHRASGGARLPTHRPHRRTQAQPRCARAPARLYRRDRRDDRRARSGDRSWRFHRSRRGRRGTAADRRQGPVRRDLLRQRHDGAGLHERADRCRPGNSRRCRSRGIR